MPGDVRYHYIGDKRFRLAEVGRGRSPFTRAPIPAQAADAAEVLPLVLDDFHLGGGVSYKRLLRAGPQPFGHERARNVDVTHPGIWLMAEGPTYINLASGHTAYGSFVIGHSAIGGSAIGGTMGGGRPELAPAWIEQYGDFLYIGLGSATAVVDPTTNGVVEVKLHPTQGRNTDADIHDDQLGVALGDGTPMEVATTPRNPTGTPATVWAVANETEDVFAQTFSSGRLGRAYKADGNLVQNVAAGASILDSDNWRPSAGERIGNENYPVTQLAEYAGVMVATKRDNAYTFRPDAGFVPSQVLPELGSFPDQDNGRGMYVLGNDIFIPAAGALYWGNAVTGLNRIGIEEHVDNQTDMVGGIWGRPAWTGDSMVFPYWLPDDGNSYLFEFTRRRSGEPGEGLWRINEVRFEEGREVRCVFYWPGDSSNDPKLFYGAGTTTNKEILAAIPWPVRGQPRVANLTGTPETSGTLTSAIDDGQHPDTLKALDRVDFPRIRNADDENTILVEYRFDGGEEEGWRPLYGNGALPQLGDVIDRAGVSIARYPDAEDDFTGIGLQLRFTFTQETGASAYLIVDAPPVAWLRLLPRHVDGYIAIYDLQAEDLAPHDTPRSVMEWLRENMGAKLPFGDTPAKRDNHVVIREVQAATGELARADDPEVRLTIQVSMRMVETS